MTVITAPLTVGRPPGTRVFAPTAPDRSTTYADLRITAATTYGGTESDSGSSWISAASLASETDSDVANYTSRAGDVSVDDENNDGGLDVTSATP